MGMSFGVAPSDSAWEPGSLMTLGRLGVTNCDSSSSLYRSCFWLSLFSLCIGWFCVMGSSMDSLSSLPLIIGET
jgi:hypothetical protein